MSALPPTRPFELDPRQVEIELVPEPQGGALTVPDELEAAAVAVPRRRWRKRLLGALGVGLVGTLVVQAVSYVTGLIDVQPLLGWPLAVLTGVTVGSGLTYAAIELRDFRRLSRRAKLRSEAERLAASELHGEAGPLIDAIAESLAPQAQTGRAVAEFRARASDALNDAEQLVLFERQVVAPIDRAAYRLVMEGSRDIGILTALAPTGLLDGVLVLWRTSVMMRQIARLYGVAPGPAATLMLLRRCFRNAALAGLADIVAHAAVEHVGASLLAMLSARAGQGAGNALLAARLGLAAVRECRPLPFITERPPRLAELRKAILETAPSQPLQLDEPPTEPRRR